MHRFDGWPNFWPQHVCMLHLTVKALGLVAGRVHPGESNSSWIMRGLLETLTGPSPAAQALRDKYLFMVTGCLAHQLSCGISAVF